MKWLKYGGVISLVIACGFLWSELASKAYIPVTKRLLAKEHREIVGFDSLYCMKVELTESEYRDAAKKLGLVDAGKDSKPHDTSSNCNVSWWNIDFPKEAAVLNLGEDGET